jgi:hypothetical protein
MTRALAALLLVASVFVAAGEAQNPPPAQTAIPGVIAASARVELVRGGFKGLEGPVASPDCT